MSSSPQNQSALAFGDFKIDSVQRVLTHQGELVPLTPKVFDLLLMLVEKHGQVVEKHQLLDEVWPGTFVEEGNLTQNISVLRKALGGQTVHSNDPSPRISIRRRRTACATDR
jgi:DNA-binding winged helix-turn-helix (wHTH) protein